MIRPRRTPLHTDSSGPITGCIGNNNRSDRPSSIIQSQNLHDDGRRKIVLSSASSSSSVCYSVVTTIEADGVSSTTSFNTNPTIRKWFRHLHAVLRLLIVASFLYYVVVSSRLQEYQPQGDSLIDSHLHHQWQQQQQQQYRQGANDRKFPQVCSHQLLNPPPLTQQHTQPHRRRRQGLPLSTTTSTSTSTSGLDEPTTIIHNNHHQHYHPVDGSIDAMTAFWLAGITCFDIDVVTLMDGSFIVSHPTRLANAMKIRDVHDDDDDIERYNLSTVRTTLLGANMNTDAFPLLDIDILPHYSKLLRGEYYYDNNNNNNDSRTSSTMTTTTNKGSVPVVPSRPFFFVSSKVDNDGNNTVPVATTAGSTTGRTTTTSTLQSSSSSSILSSSILSSSSSSLLHGPLLNIDLKLGPYLTKNRLIQIVHTIFEWNIQDNVAICVTPLTTTSDADDGPSSYMLDMLQILSDYNNNNVNSSNNSNNNNNDIYNIKRIPLGLVLRDRVVEDQNVTRIHQLLDDHSNSIRLLVPSLRFSYGWYESIRSHDIYGKIPMTVWTIDSISDYEYAKKMNGNISSSYAIIANRPMDIPPFLLAQEELQ